MPISSHLILSLLREYAAEQAATQSAKIPRHFVRPILETVAGEQIAAGALFDSVPRAFVVGAAGAGKTTLLRWLTNVYSERCGGSDDAWPCACYMTAREISRAESPDDLIEAVRDRLADGVEAGLAIQEVSVLLKERKLALLIDAVDEIAGEGLRQKVLEVINDLARQYPQAYIIVASRPASLSFSFPGFEFLKLVDFSGEQTARLAEALSPTQPEIANAFLARIRQSQVLSALARTPLLLELLFETYVILGRLPDNVSEIYSDFTDYLLSTWETTKGIGARSRMTLAQKHMVLESVALLATSRQKRTLNINDVEHSVFSFAPDEPDFRLAANDIIGSGLLQMSSSGEVSFLHHSFAEYYRARALLRDPARLYRLAGSTDAQQTIVFAAGLMDDVAGLVTAAVTRGQLLLAAKCISFSRTESEQLVAYVARAFAEEVGERFLSLVAAAMPGRSAPQPNAARDTYEELLHAWDYFSAPDLRNHEKGRRFEVFASAFFGTFFSVLERDLHTESGELDLMLAVTKLDPFWIEFGSDILVECKNTVNTALKDVAIFRDKLMQANVRLGFFVSVNGFTADAVRTLRNSVSDSTRALVVPLTGEEIKLMLIRREGFEDFFKKRVRDFKMLRRY